MTKLINILAFPVLVLCLQVQGHLNNNPVIGVLSQATGGHRQYGDEYIDTTYVKYLEMAGAKVVAIKGGQSEVYYEEMFNQINGLLLPGGDVSLNVSNYAHSSNFFFQRALQANRNGDYFPLWGTCQGFEMLTVLAAGRYDLTATDSENMTAPLELVPDFRRSRLLGQAPPDIIQYLTKEPVAANFHYFSLASKTYQKTKALNNFYRVISYNHDRKHVEYVSTYEAYAFPFYGVQWHPEKNIFLWRRDKADDRSLHAIKVSQYMANFFVDEARKNFHSFKTPEIEAKTIVENDVLVFFPETLSQYYIYNISMS